MSQKRNEAIKKVLSTESEELDQYIAAKVDELQAVRTDVKSEKIRKAQAERRCREAEEKHERQEKEFAKREKEIKSQLESMARDYTATKEKYDGFARTNQQELDDLKSAVKASTKESREREAYRKEQESIIQHTLDDGSARIADLDYQVKQLLKQQQATLQEAAKSEATRDELLVEVRTLEEKRELLDDRYTRAVLKYKNDLTELKAQKAEEQDALEKLRAESKSLVERLGAKERELDARSQILDEKEAKLFEERRYLDSRKYMYE
jgi:chromosome segregation ATPase